MKTKAIPLSGFKITAKKGKFILSVFPKKALPKAKKRKVVAS